MIKKLILVAGFIALFLISKAQYVNYKFEQININDGLSQNTVNCIIQDQKGFMWFGTENGLNRFDGYEFVIYKYLPNDSNSISHSAITTLYEDEEGFIWIGTRGGLNKYDPKKDKFTVYKVPGNKPNLVQHNSIVSFLRDNEGIFWIGTEAGLCKLTKKSDTIQVVKDFPVQSNPEVLTIFQEKDGDLWFCTENTTVTYTKSQNIYKPIIGNKNQRIGSVLENNKGEIMVGVWNSGIYKYNKITNKITPWTDDPLSGELANQTIYSMYFDKKTNSYWFGTFNNGIYHLEKKSGKNILTHYGQSIENAQNFTSSTINVIYEDKGGVIWIGTRQNGISKTDINKQRFLHYRKIPNNKFSLSSNTVRAVIAEKNDNLWIGTEGDGLNYFDKQKNRFYRVHYAYNNLIHNDKINTLIIDRYNRLWIGTNGAGIYVFPTNKFRLKNNELYADENAVSHINDNIQLTESYLSNPYVMSTVEDNFGNIIVGTWLGLNIILSNKNKSQTNFRVIHYLNSPDNKNTISNNKVLTVFEDSENVIWIGSKGGGLDKLVVDKNYEKATFTNYSTHKANPDGINNNIIFDIYEDSRKNLWIGTGGSGLALLNRDNSTFTHFTELDGLCNDIVSGIIEDINHNLWLSTSKGLSFFNPQTKTFKNYFVEDGLQGNDFNLGACYSGESGYLYFGGNNGVTGINVDNLHENNILPQIVITDFQILNESVKPNKKINHRIIIDKAIPYVKDLTLTHKNNVFSFEFAALHYSSPSKNRYKYQLEGFDKTWINTTADKRYVSYSNLKPGTYTFKVIASNNDGVWNDTPASINIKVLPPYWQTNWAYLLYTIIIATLIFIFRRFIISRIELKNKYILEHMEKEKLDDLYQMKLTFFSNISHEFRTPLTLIINPIEKLLETIDLSHEVKKQLQLIRKNSRRLYLLINQLLEISKIETDTLEIYVSKNDIVDYIHSIFHAFESLSDKKNISYTFNTSVKKKEVFFDGDKLEKIIGNILSNAFKYTPENGGISLNLKFIQATNQNPTEYIEIAVSDSGKGIPQDQLEKIFNRYYQADSQEKNNFVGSGIGLSLVKSLVDKYNGQIQATNNPETGITFTVILPVSENAFDQKNLNSNIPEIHEHLVDELDDTLENILNDQKPEKPTTVDQSALPILLIIDDNVDMLKMIQSQFNDKFKILLAEDGIAGKQLALDNIPDLIISDVMMPGIDGIHLCSELKTNESTSHIPIILLTAKESEDSKIEGTEKGADAYISKPFNPKYLYSKVDSLIDTRNKLKKQFSKNVYLQPKDIAITSVDEIFMRKVFDIIEENMADTEFNVEELSRKIHMSRTHLHRKMKQLTDESPSGVIRLFRIKRAEKLLVDGQLTVSEILYQIGINSRSYFNKCFREIYGMSPSEYVESKKIKK